jgi:hypothetical protein
MSILIDAVSRWLLRQPAVRGFIQDVVAAEIRAELVSLDSPTRKAMARITRASARDLFEEEREKAREVIELSAEHERWARGERERLLASSAFPSGAVPAAAFPVAPDRPYVSPADPLTGPWDASPPPRCGTCSEPIRWSEERSAWTHRNATPVPHAPTYALADAEQTLQMPRVRSDSAPGGA